MRIKILSSLVTADGVSHGGGEVVEWDDKDAASLIAAGHAEAAGVEPAEEKPAPVDDAPAKPKRKGK